MKKVSILLFGIVLSLQMFAQKVEMSYYVRQVNNLNLNFLNSQVSYSPLFVSGIGIDFWKVGLESGFFVNKNDVVGGFVGQTFNIYKKDLGNDWKFVVNQMLEYNFVPKNQYWNMFFGGNMVLVKNLGFCRLAIPIVLGGVYAMDGNWSMDYRFVVNLSIPLVKI